MTKIFLGGLSATIQEMEIAILVSLYGRVETIKVVRDRANGKCKGYAFIEVTDVSDAKSIISALHGETFKGNVLTIKIADDGPAKPKPSTGFKGKRPRVQR